MWCWDCWPSIRGCIRRISWLDCVFRSGQCGCSIVYHCPSVRMECLLHRLDWYDNHLQFKAFCLKLSRPIMYTCMMKIVIYLSPLFHTPAACGVAFLLLTTLVNARSYVQRESEKVAKLAWAWDNREREWKGRKKYCRTIYAGCDTSTTDEEREAREFLIINSFAPLDPTVFLFV